ncbi:MAG: N-acetyltransferase [Rikenellaceae bacterium]|nr:N-acetyltransferase [Rikenellaceae bacterium]
MCVIVRQEKSADRPFVNDLIKATFEKVRESDHREHFLVERLRQSDAFIPQLSLVAETCDKRIIGYILLTEADILTAQGFTPSLSVAPVAVLPEYQNRGIGGMLIEEAHRIASVLGYGSALVLGHKDYYPRFGYRRASCFGITFPFDVPEEYCMAIELRTDALKGIDGTVRYPDAFFM